MQAAPVTRHPSLVTDGGTPSYYRIQDPVSELYVRFSWKTGEHKPIVRARLAPRRIASRFPTWRAARDAFALYCAGAALEIVRSDA